jgi:glutamine amidotransferase
MKCDQPENVLGVTQYGYEFTSAISHKNIMGVQFNPEKSHRFGMQLLKNFTDL